MLATSFKVPVLNAGELPKQNIRDQVYAVLRDRMYKGEITVHDRLIDLELAAQLDVSRMPVREALLQLKSEGYLEGTSRGFVMPQFTPRDIANMFETRLLLEPTAAATACSHATAQGLKRMQTAIDQTDLTHRKGDVLGYISAIGAFWTAWVEMVPNDHLAQVINRLRDHAQAVRLATLKDKDIRALSLARTKEILDAFLKQDPEGVKDKVAGNLQAAATSYAAKLQSELGEAAVEPPAPRRRSRQG